jgi:tRNA threonylcarbamoyladenosine modification (KEOPS) complex  Pcc1 subunit
VQNVLPDMHRRRSSDIVGKQVECGDVGWWRASVNSELRLVDDVQCGELLRLLFD